MLTLSLVACKRGTGSAAEAETVVGPSSVAENPGETPSPSVEHELDRTIWDCEWSIVVFWGPHWYWNHRDVAMAAMGGNTMFTREDLDVAYGPAGSFSAAMRRRVWPNGQHDPVEFDGPLEPYAYSIEGRKLTIRHDAWTDGPLECTAGCYDQDFIDFMDEHYGTQTSVAAVAEKMRLGDCGG